uniref:Uncharacterized protein n=1 Tax=Anguilla anguilla TaxID=7936 RepID=A0A0E9QLP8_ANGAN
MVQISVKPMCPPLLLLLLRSTQMMKWVLWCRQTLQTAGLAAGAVTVML